MNKKPESYGTLCSMFYDATKKFAPTKEVDFYAHFIEQNPGRVLEVMSGSGRLQIPLIQRGYVVDGVDNSAIMLDRCRQRAAQLAIDLDLYEQSLQELELPHTYRTATIAVGSFQLLTDPNDARAALHNIKKHMTADGTLLIDIFTPDLLAEPRSVRIARIDEQTIIRLTTRHIFEEQERLAHAFCFYELVVNGQVMEQEDEHMQVTWRTDAEWQQLLEDTGFTLLNIYEETFRSAGPSRILHAQVSQ